MFPQRLKECRKARVLSLRELATVFTNMKAAHGSPLPV